MPMRQCLGKILDDATKTSTLFLKKIVIICNLILPSNTAVFAAKETEIRNTHVGTVFQIRRKQIEQECLSWAVYPSDADQKNFVRFELWYDFSNSLSVQFRLGNPLIVCKLWNVGYLYRIVVVYIYLKWRNILMTVHNQ